MSRREELERLLDDRTEREAWLEDEPSRIFGLLAADRLPEDRLDALQASVEAAIEPPKPTAHRWWGAAAAVLVLGLGGWWAVDALREEPVQRAEIVEPLPVERLPVEPMAASGPVRGIELLSSPGEARVVDLSVGDTQIVMIFDEALDL